MSVLELQSELELIDRARQGSVDAFEQLVLHYQDRLYRFLLVRANNRADAEDVLQDTTLAEISKVMKRPVSWVKVNLMRARRRLSKELQDYRFESVASRNEVTL